IVMLDFEDSIVTYTALSSLFGGLSDIRSLGVDGPPVMPEDPYAYVIATFQAPPSPDYVSGPEYPPSPDFVPELVYPEFMPPEDESDPEEDPEEDDDPKKDPADYPADGGDDGDDEDESSDDDEDDDVDIKEDEEEEEHPAHADSTAVALPAVAKLLAIHTPPPSPFSPWSSPLPQIPSPPLPLILSSLPVSSPPPASPIRSRQTQGYLTALDEIEYRSSAHTTRPLGGFRANYGFVATMDREIMRDLERDVGYGITDTWDEMLVDMPGAPATDDTELGIEVMSLRTRVVAQQAVITELQAADRRRQAAITDMLATDRRRQTQFIEALKLLKRL
ncbi:hypothetical protein Tco_1464151, partial [Tanacetum coccineum]